MTGPEFAATHGDSSTWTEADIETFTNLTQIDAYEAAKASKATTVDDHQLAA